MFAKTLNEICTMDWENNNIENKELKPLRKKRASEYNSKTNGVAKILSETKKYVAGNYGERSDEYNKIGSTVNAVKAY